MRLGRRAERAPPVADRAAGCRRAGSCRPSVTAISAKGMSSTSCNRNAARSAGVSRSNASSKAKDRSSASSVAASGASAAASMTGSDSQPPAVSRYANLNWKASAPIQSHAL